MRVTVCQLPDPVDEFERAWTELVEHARGSDLVVLPELPFHPWVAWTDQYDPATWDAAVSSHDEWVRRLSDLGAGAVAGSRPVRTASGAGHNRAFIWDRGQVTDGHDKYYLPEEPGFWEATWYSRGDGTFDAMSLGEQRVGFLLCTEMWFTDRAREYARQGVQLLLTPRVTEPTGVDKWIAGGRSAAVMSGAFSLSSNRMGSNHGVDFGGAGWVIDPDGAVLATTTLADPVVTVDIDLTLADAAKLTYPRYVEE
ncbi:MAG: carbon-nitrogen hydrolase family protein [Acidimicrobiia bacterium]|nr:carbon-nitrogen hydrolase family protein [Acidimicrobiia bacterium]